MFFYGKKLIFFVPQTKSKVWEQNKLYLYLTGKKKQTFFVGRSCSKAVSKGYENHYLVQMKKKKRVFFLTRFLCVFKKIYISVPPFTCLTFCLFFFNIRENSTHESQHHVFPFEYFYANTGLFINFKFC